MFWQNLGLNVEAGRLSIVPFRGSNDWTTLGLLFGHPLP